MLNIVSNKNLALLSILGLTLALATQFAEAAPLSENLKQSLESSHAKVIVLIDADGKAKTIDTDGKEITSCGKVNGKRIPKNCQTEGMTTTSLNKVIVPSFAPPTATATPAMAAGFCPNGYRWIVFGGIYYRYCP
ncbi:MAG: hypothetical protein WCI11_17640 [Candidatus Methylumidiphilus sp.]